MDLKDIKRPYDVVLGLGYWCDIANQLKRHNLRQFSSPFDWIWTPSLSDINKLLRNRFKDFMKVENMKFVNYGIGTVDNKDNLVFTDESPKTYILEDTKYNITSVHDFPVLPNQNWEASYPYVKEKFDRRINRFFEKINNSELILFVRYYANYSEVAELHSILSELTKSQFHILVINPVEGIQRVQEKCWNINGVVSIEIPFIRKGEHLLADMKNVNQEDWDYILNGIALNN
ncbi:DUF1796 family putative cysteine peptidase [Priestia megaterium]|uniref:DUF1796 family putative cysteine peptidase n=1 Tax=Priestia megaterium TaxID=1404 RepID=UPI002E1AB88C|nr:DUF1796 family putative cysteine peptidase [Priestia megaterium]